MSTHTPNLLDELCPSGVSRKEVLSVIAKHFPSSVHDSGTDFILFPSHPPYALRVEFDGDGYLSGIFQLPGLSAAALNSIRLDIEKEFIETAAVTVDRQVFFSFYPVNTWWRYQNAFQILPVPPSAPKPVFVYAKHPFLVEYSYSKSSDPMIDSGRRTRATSTLQLLLNAFLIPGISWISGRTVGTHSHHWTLMPNGVDVQYLQESYNYRDVWPRGSFSPVDELPPITEIPPNEIPPNEYYSERHISTGDPLDLPSDLNQTLNQFFALDSAQQDRFLHACYWLNQANATSSFSLMLLAAVQAIEALIRKPKGTRQCAHCGLTVGPGPTKLFNTFLEVFLPEPFKKTHDWKSLYGTRSGLSHGSSSPLLVDLDSWFFAMNPRETQQYEAVGTAMRTARLCLRNWLNCEPLIHEHVRKAAYFIWQKQGCPGGRDQENWFDGITQLRNLSFLSMAN